MSVIELATHLKQFEQAAPGRDAYVVVEYDEWDRDTDTYVAKRGVVPVVDFKWGGNGAVVVAGRVP